MSKCSYFLDKTLRMGSFGSPTRKHENKVNLENHNFKGKRKAHAK